MALSVNEELNVIPELADGVLPEGIHLCTMEEVAEAFGRFWRSDRRLRLTEQLRRFVEDARKSGIVAAVVIDGSYVTQKPEPDDIDLIVALRPGLPRDVELRPFEYNVQSRRMVKQLYRFDVKVAEDGSSLYAEHVDFFAEVRSDDPEQSTTRLRKGLLRIEL